MTRKRNAARATDASLSGDPRLEADLASVRSLLASATTDSSDVQRARMIFERVRSEILRTPVRTHRSVPKLRVGGRAAVLGFALAASVGGAVLVAADRALEPQPAPAATAEAEDEPGRGLDDDGSAGGFGPEGDDGDITVPRPGEGARPGSGTACQSELAGLEVERAEVRAAYEDSLRGPRRDRNDELADLDREVAATMADFDEEAGDINADYRAQMRELEQERQEADEEDRREIEREMEELREEWDAALAEVDQDRRASQREFGAERRAIVAEYEEAVAAAQADRDAEFAQLDVQEREIRARCA